MSIEEQVDKIFSQVSVGTSEETKEHIIRQILELIKQARIDELEKVYYDTAQGDVMWGKESMFIEERLTQLKECEFGCKGAGEHYHVDKPQTKD